MVQLEYKKHRLNKFIELFKYCFTLCMLCFLVAKAPDQTSQIVTASAAFILGGSKLKTKLGF